MTNRIPPNGIPTAQIVQDLNAELMRIPAAFLNSIRQEAGLEGKEVLLFSPEEKVSSLALLSDTMVAHFDGSEATSCPNIPTKEQKNTRSTRIQCCRAFINSIDAIGEFTEFAGKNRQTE
jgi:hypothetical protein